MVYRPGPPRAGSGGAGAGRVGRVRQVSFTNRDTLGAPRCCPSRGWDRLTALPDLCLVRTRPVFRGPDAHSGGTSMKRSRLTAFATLALAGVFAATIAATKPTTAAPDLSQ